MPASNIRTLTFISRRAPYGEDFARAMLDMVMAAAVFDQQVQLVFMDDGVYQLLADQAPEAIHNKNLSANLSALPLYGVETVYADAESLALRGLQSDKLVLPVTVADSSQLKALIAASDQVFLA